MPERVGGSHTSEQHQASPDTPSADVVPHFDSSKGQGSNGGASQTDEDGSRIDNNSDDRSYAPDTGLQSFLAAAIAGDEFTQALNVETSSFVADDIEDDDRSSLTLSLGSGVDDGDGSSTIGDDSGEDGTVTGAP